jgi:hypothetical protein
MAVPLNLLRALLGLFCIFFAYLLGRSIIRLRRGLQRPRSLYGWLIRMLVTAAAILWGRGLDRIAVVVYVLAAASLALGIWDERRPKKQEDLTRQMFGE